MAPVAPNSKRSLWGPLVNFEHLHDYSSKYNAKCARIPEAARIAIAGKKAPQAQLILASKPYGIHMNIRTVRRLLADIGGRTNDNYCIRWAQFPDAMLRTVALNINSDIVRQMICAFFLAIMRESIICNSSLRRPLCCK